MNKRQFIQALAGTLPALGGSTFALASRKTRNWVWITLEREQPADAWKRDFARMRAAGIDAVIPEVYDGRQAYWASNRLPVHAERLEMLLPLAKSEGLEVHAWMWCMPCMLESVLARHADWYNVNAMGQSAADKPAYVDYYRFLDPAHPEVREFIQGTVTELAGIDGLAGVHLDYIRHPDAILPKGLWAKYGLVQDRVYPEFDYGYTPYSRSVFKKKHGVDPLQIEDPLIHEAWFKYRLDSVTDLV
ncbi:MAG: family 10 glycosylhydrolase, partial [Steroidobacteraceae bacterium]